MRLSSPPPDGGRPAITRSAAFAPSPWSRRSIAHTAPRLPTRGTSRNSRLDATQNEAGYVCVCLSVCMFPPLPNSLSVSLSLSFSLTLYSYPYHNQQIRHLDPDFRRLCCKYRGRGRCRWCSNNILRRKARQTHARIPRTSTPSHQ